MISTRLATHHSQPCGATWSSMRVQPLMVSSHTSAPLAAKISTVDIE
jgi:hypothetical protein